MSLPGREAGSVWVDLSECVQWAILVSEERYRFKV